MQPPHRTRGKMSVNAARLPVVEAAVSPSPHGAGARGASSCSALGECVSRTVRRYLSDIGDTECTEGLHALVLREVEVPMLREVLAFHDGNQSRAAAALGINRATLRKKLATHGLL